MMNVGWIWEKTNGFLITGAKALGSDDSGQSLFEFLFMLPMLVGLTVMLVRVSSAIQISIVNQKYARAQALFLTFNNSFYPEKKFQDQLVQDLSNQMLIGVSENKADGDGSKYIPKAPIQLITRSKRIAASDAPNEEPRDARAKVRIRTTVTLCTPSLWIASAQGNSPMVVPGGPSPLTEQSRISNFCGSSMKYE